MSFKDILTKIWGWIKSFFSSVLKKPERIIIIVLVILLGILYFNHKSLAKKYDNIIVMQKDTIELYQNKAKELYAQNTAYITDIKNLKISNEELYDECKKLKENPLIITKTEVKLVIDSIYVKGDSTYVSEDKTKYICPVSYKDEWFSFKGKTSFDMETKEGGLYMDHIRSNTDIYLDFITQGKDLKIITKATNPYLQINNTEGVMLSPEQNRILKKRFDKPWALVIGVGPTVTINDNKVCVYPGIQLTLGYKLISF